MKRPKSLTEPHNIIPELEHLIEVSLCSQNSAVSMSQALITTYKDHSRGSRMSEERVNDRWSLLDSASLRCGLVCASRLGSAGTDLTTGG